MSQWTQVVAAFYIGGNVADPDMDMLLESIMGPMYARFSSNPEDLEKIKVPTGTEGPLHWDINFESPLGSFPRGTVTVWGSLRDFTSLTTISTWFMSTVRELRAHGLVYSAVCTATVSSAVASKDNNMRLTLTDADVKDEGK